MFTTPRAATFFGRRGAALVTRLAMGNARKNRLDMPAYVLLAVLKSLRAATSALLFSLARWLTADRLCWRRA